MQFIINNKTTVYSLILISVFEISLLEISDW